MFKIYIYKIKIKYDQMVLLFVLLLNFYHYQLRNILVFVIDIETDISVKRKVGGSLNKFKPFV